VCVYCAVRADSLNIIQVNLGLLAVPCLRPPLTAKVGVQFQDSLCGICGERSGSGTFFLRVLCFPPSQSFHPHSILLFIHTLLLPEGKTGEAREFGERWIAKCCHWARKGLRALGVCRVRSCSGPRANLDALETRKSRLSRPHCSLRSQCTAAFPDPSVRSVI
jgi:hypothetical protein